MAQGNVHFQQHAWGYFAFKLLLRCTDDRSLPLVEKICDSMGFRAANRLRIDKVRTAGYFSVLPLLRITRSNRSLGECVRYVCRRTCSS